MHYDPSGIMIILRGELIKITRKYVASINSSLKRAYFSSCVSSQSEIMYYTFVFKNFH